MKRLTKKEFELLPPYVWLRDTCLRLVRNDDGQPYRLRYFRDGGYWSVDFEEKDGKLFTVSRDPETNGVELRKATKRDWRSDNKGYLERGDDAITWDSYKTGGSAFGRPALA